MTKINKTKLALLGATAFFTATSAHAQVADTWAIGGDVEVNSSNTTDTVTLDGTDGAFVDTSSIAAGYKNSISSAAVGSSASSSFTYFNNSAVDASAVATIDGNVTVTSGNTAAVLNTADLTTSAIITTGSGNSISLAAVGSSASGSATSTIGGAATASTVTFEIGGDVLIQSGDGSDTVDGADTLVGGNTGEVQLLLASGIQLPTISGGNSNSVSAAGVGSSSSYSLAINSTDASAFEDVSYTVGNVGVTASNGDTGTVTVDADGANAVIDTALIEAGDANSISVAAVGASASVSQSDTIHAFPAPGTGPVTAAITMAEVSATSFNGASITASAQMDNAPTITAGSNNSISVAGVGSSASVSFGVSDFSGAGLSGAVTTADLITVTSVNTGAVAVAGGMATPTITDGYNNSISNAAVGASASQAITHLNLAIPAQ